MKWVYLKVTYVMPVVKKLTISSGYTHLCTYVQMVTVHNEFYAWYIRICTGQEVHKTSSVGYTHSAYGVNSFLDGCTVPEEGNRWRSA